MPQKEDIINFINKKYNRLTVIEDVEIIDGVRYIMAKCECGSIGKYRLQSLKQGNTKSCGCIKSETSDNFIGKKYNKLTIIEDLGIYNQRRTIKAICECGNSIECVLKDVRSGNTKSCGCLWFTQNWLSIHPLYRVWASMISRCYNPSAVHYDKYGGAGISVCEEWRISFNSFYEWAIDTWKDGLQLDKDILAKEGEGKIYSPNTCCFITAKENCRNRSNNVIVTYENESKTIVEWSEYFGVSYKTVYGRVKRGLKIGKDPIQIISKLYKQKVAS